MDKNTAISIFRQFANDETEQAKNNRYTSYHTQIVNNGNGSVVINNGGIQSNTYHTNIDNNENLTEGNKQELREMISRFEQENKRRTSKPANDD